MSEEQIKNKEEQCTGEQLNEILKIRCGLI